MALLLWSALFGGLPGMLHAQDELHGRVVDAATGEGVALATVMATRTHTGAASDETGHFLLRLPPGEHMLRISAIGYAARLVAAPAPPFEAPLMILLQPAIIPVEEVVVSGAGPRIDDPAASSHHLHATEDLLDRAPGADFIQRANFAWEPVIRGLSGGQVGLVIDGVKITGACVDKMDPASAYVEIGNLEKLELSKGGFDLTRASQIGGTIYLATRKPRFDEPFHADVEGGYESASSLRRGSATVGLARGKTSVRGSFSYKTANDFVPGGGAALRNSGYRKNNYKFDVARRTGSRHQLTASFLGDNAWDVGYPVLLMDATLAQAKIYSLTHAWTPRRGWLEQWETRLYYNTVDHWMDDFGRDVMARRVMRGMNMPMYGATQTAGGLSTLDLLFGARRLRVNLDVYETRSFGDMWMFSLFENIQDMYLLNLGDVRVRHGAASADFSMPLRPRLHARVNARLDYSPRQVEREEAVAMLQGRWGLDDTEATYALGSGSATVSWTVAAGTRLRLALAHVGRLPTHVENYGHYAYNYVDGYFYTGNPALKPERSSQVELGFERTTARYALRASAYANYIRDYIAGFRDEALTGGSRTLRFRLYGNARAAFLAGGELSAVARLTESLEFAATAAWTRGQNLETGEPMYLIPPLTSLLSVRLDRNRWWSEIEARMAMPQNRVARVAADEDGTDGYFVANARGSVKVASGVELRGGLENLFDAFYHEHLSFGNLPNPGRNLYLAFAVSL